MQVVSNSEGIATPAKRTGRGGHNRTHGMSQTRLYRIWCAMKKRCENPAAENFEWYGGKGVRVCDEWDKSFEPFRDWSMQHGYADDLEIDRIETSGGYSPLNCRWTTHEAQSNNKTNNRILAAFGEFKSMAEWSKDMRCVVSYYSLRSRLRYGWDAETAMKTPARPFSRRGESCVQS